MMRITHVNVVRPRWRPDPDALLEAWPTLGDVAHAVARTGAAVTVIQPFHRAAEIERNDVRFRFISEPALPGRATGCMPWRLAKAVRDCDPDVIHVNGLDFPLHIRALCGLGRPVLVQDHSSRAHIRPRRRRWGLAKAAGVAFTDVRQAEPFAAFDCFAECTRIFAIAESSTRFGPGDRLAARGVTGLHGDPAILWVGRLDPNKDPLTILDAVAAALPALPGLQLWCCFHEQPLLPAIETRLARSADLAAHVHLLGQVPHRWIELLCQAADFFMLASQHESAGYALIEAIACGATPIVSDIPSFRHLTAEGRIGALVPLGDADGFARALIDLASQPQDRLRQAAIDHFERNLSFEAVGRALHDAYVALLDARA
jgi:glycosyltransferase involved in cell wall biosynthesis